MNENFILLQDGASVRQTDMVTSWMNKDRISRIKDFPGYSPDLNVIEHVWTSLKKQLEMNPVDDIEDLWETIKVMWSHISINFIHTLVDNMPSRLEAIKKAKRGHTTY